MARTDDADRKQHGEAVAVEEQQQLREHSQYTAGEAQIALAELAQQFGASQRTDDQC